MFGFFSHINKILYILLLASIIGYILAVLKEKFYLFNNIIIIDKKSVTEDFLDEADIKIFALGGENVKSGDEIKIVLHGNQKISGIVIGAKKKDNMLLLITHNNSVEKLKVSSIKKFRIISKYGKFFK